jgi:U-box domain
MDIKSTLVCPISLDLIDDPVTVLESGITYERESLCGSLRLYPDLEPSTGQRFGHPIHFTADLSVLQILDLIRDEDVSETSDSQNAITSLLLCPLSLEVMSDPVMVHESGITYDRKSLCTELLLVPDRDPFTNQKFEHPLHYTGSITMRRIIDVVCGESQLQRHDDAGFHEQYQVAWIEGTPSSEENVRGRPLVPSPVETGRGDDNDRDLETARPEESRSSQRNNATQGNTSEAQQQFPSAITDKDRCTFAAVAFVAFLVVCIVASTAASPPSNRRATLSHAGAAHEPLSDAFCSQLLHQHMLLRRCQIRLGEGEHDPNTSFARVSPPVPRTEFRALPAFLNFDQCALV